MHAKAFVCVCVSHATDVIALFADALSTSSLNCVSRHDAQSYSIVYIDCRLVQTAKQIRLD